MQLKKVKRGRFGQPPASRIGRNQLSVWRAAIGYGGELTTAQLMEFAYPRLGRSQPRWRWYAVRLAAERYMMRVSPRSRPLRWRLRPGVLPEND
jgi:hypothetical protein